MINPRAAATLGFGFGPRAVASVGLSSTVIGMVRAVVRLSSRLAQVVGITSRLHE